MRTFVADSAAALARMGADHIAVELTENPRAVLGLATGSTPLGIYRELVTRFDRGEIDFSACHTVNLDEYVGLAPEDEQSYTWYMYKHLFCRINIRMDRTHIPNGMAEDLAAECERYNAVLDQLGGIDIQLLGIGHDGHIGFNEPGDFFIRRTHCATLSEQTLEANKRFFAAKKEVPKKAVTMGIQDIMRAKKILLIAMGEEKGQVLRRALFEEITPRLPASILQLHSNLVLLLDRAAAAQL